MAGAIQNAMRAARQMRQRSLPVSWKDIVLFRPNAPTDGQGCAQPFAIASLLAPRRLPKLPIQQSCEQPSQNEHGCPLTAKAL